MSLINDALRKASQSPKHDPNPMVKLQPVQPPPPRRSGPGLMVILVCLVLAGGATLGIWNYWNKKYKSGSTENAKAGPTNAAAAAAAAAAKTNNNPIARAAAVFNKVANLNKEGDSTAEAMKAPSPKPPAATTTAANASTSPVAPPVTGKPWSTIPGMPKLQGILFSKDPSAIIEGKSVRVGDQIGGAKVIEIKKTSVRMQLNGEIHEVTIK